MKPSRSDICAWVAEAYAGMTEAVTKSAMMQLIGPVMNREVTKLDSTETLDSLAAAIETVEDLTEDFTDIAIDNDDLDYPDLDAEDGEDDDGDRSVSFTSYCCG